MYLTAPYICIYFILNKNAYVGVSNESNLKFIQDNNEYYTEKIQLCTETNFAKKT